MIGWLIVAAVVLVLLGSAWLYDRKVRGRGRLLRGSDADADLGANPAVEAIRSEVEHRGSDAGGSVF